MLELTFEDHLLTFGNHPLTFEDHPLTAGSITLDEMEEVVGILYNLDGCEKVLIINSNNVNIAITIITIITIILFTIYFLPTATGRLLLLLTKKETLHWVKIQRLY